MTFEPAAAQRTVDALLDAVKQLGYSKEINIRV